MVATALFSRVKHHVALGLIELLEGPGLLEDAEFLADELIGSLLLIVKVGVVVVVIVVISLEAEEVLERLVFVEDLEALVDEDEAVLEVIDDVLPLVLGLLLLLESLLKLF